MWYAACLVIGYLLGIVTLVAGYLYFSGRSLDGRLLADKKAIEERLKQIENL